MQHGRVAIKCMAGLLLAAPHFNYRSGESEEEQGHLPDSVTVCLMHCLHVALRCRACAS